MAKAVGGVMYQPYYNYQAGPDAKLGRAIWGIIGLGTFQLFALNSVLKLHCEELIKCKFRLLYTMRRIFANSITVAGAFGYDPVSPPEGQNIVTTTRSHSNRTVVDAVEAM